MRIELEILLLLVAYFFGSVPFGYLYVKKLTGKDIREMGSGNIGSTNVRRIAGRKAAIMTQLADMLKGLLPVGVIWYIQFQHIYTFDQFFIYLLALACILGHNFSIFLKFNGGKGVNTTLGASILLSPVSVFVSVFVYYLVKWRSKYVSLGSICLALSLPIVDLFIH
ncbi:MAG: glycerol-3-phosphate 1-O-acyltransferase PlsY, partial [Paludibacter sp.]|nr:glycerol-3-phosphate 1-O-acyltransferase PlsY [Paludibacter sp.]